MKDYGREACFAFAELRHYVSCEPFGNGHINGTYLVLTEEGGKFVLQRVNSVVFPKPENVMENIIRVTEFLSDKIKAEGEDPARATLHFLRTEAGADSFLDSAGNVWRAYRFIDDSITYESAENDEEFALSGEAFGVFQRRLADFPAERLNEVIPHFHDTPRRYEAFLDAVEKDICDRVKTVEKEIAFYRSHADFYATLEMAHEEGRLPLKVTHNDTKLNNILFDEKTRRPICVIDLDTVMPGYSVNDFGDSIRFGASTAAEDEKDLSKVHFSLDRYRAYAEGFLRGAGDGLSAGERELLPEGALMMTLECGMRFLTDYLLGDNYFRIAYPDHNLVRCRTQIRLAEEMFASLPEMKKIVGF